MSDSSFPEFNQIERFPHRTIPSLPLLGLDDQEQQLLKTLLADGLKRRNHFELSEAYLLGAQVVKNRGRHVGRDVRPERVRCGAAACVHGRPVDGLFVLDGWFAGRAG